METYIIYEITCPFHVSTIIDLLAYSADDNIQRDMGFPIVQKQKERKTDDTFFLIFPVK